MQLSFDSKIFYLDNNQIFVFKELKKIADLLNQKRSFFGKLFFPINVKSLYIYGQVGRGKSMLMKYSFSLIKSDKIYFHFNDFMQNLHKEINNVRLQNKKKNILHIAINNIVGKSKILCLDEFQIDNVVDAMILSDVFKYIFRKKIIVIFTSNSHPMDLYQDGLQREYFLQFVRNILSKECQILNLDGDHDYRSLAKDSKTNFLYPINDYNKNIFDQILQNYLSGAKMTIWEDNIMGRKVTIKNSYKNIALLDFLEIFSSNSGVVDYMVICQKFQIILIKNIPKLDNLYNNETKRFILFIDEAYENNVKLIILSENSIDKIYQDGLLYEMFQRSASRLKQLTSK